MTDYQGLCLVQAPQTMRGTIALPASKSISNRVLIIYALSDKTHRPTNLSICDDTDVMLRALATMGPEIDIMAAGTAMRFLTAFLSITPGDYVITGTARMKQRPIHILVDALRSIGADITYVEKEGYPPLKIHGQALQGNLLSINSQVSSQYISALMMIAPCLPDGLNLQLEGELISKPYIELTKAIMEEYGAKVEWTAAHTLRIHPTRYVSVAYRVESDWSAASYWFQMVALSSDEEAGIRLPLLCLPSLQGDHVGAELFQLLGVQATVDGDAIVLTKCQRTVESLDRDFKEIPDLAQTFVVTCCLLNIPFRFTGLQTLKIKETDRIEALIAEMRKLGYIVQQEDDSVLYWTGERCTADEAPVIATYHDHRMAMAFAPASLLVDNVHIADMEVVTKSYPDYWEHLEEVGYNIQLKK